MRIAETAEVVDEGPSGAVVSVVIATFGRPAMVGPCVSALLAQTYSPMDVLVVDQSADDRTREAVELAAAGDRRIRYVRANHRGCSDARNLGVSLSEAELVLFTDDDCIPGPDWVANMAATFVDSELSAVVGRITSDQPVRRPMDLAIKDDPTPAQYSGAQPAWKVGHGANTAVRRRVMLTSGGFDPVLGPGSEFHSCEDGDLLFRLLRAGHVVAYCPAAVVQHRQWRRWADRCATEKRYGLGAGAQFGKYIRCSSPEGWRLLGTWLWEFGVRRFAAGMLKWRDPRVVWLSLYQLVFPWLGLWSSRRRAIDRERLLYKPRGSDPSPAPATMSVSR